METTVRANFTLPSGLYFQLREDVAVRQRSKFVSLAIKSKLRKKRKKMSYAEGLRAIAGKISAQNHPEWKDLDSIVAWINAGRAAANRDYSYIPYGGKKKR